MNAKESSKIEGGSWPSLFAGLSYIFDVGGIRTQNHSEAAWIEANMV